MAIPFNVIGNPVAMAIGSQEDAFYRDVNGNISYWWWDGHFHVENWTIGTDAPLANGNPVTMFIASEQHVFYRDEDDKISHIWKYDENLHTDNWTAEAGAPQAAGDPITMVTGSQQHIFYRDQSNEIIHIRWKYDSGPSYDWITEENVFLEDAPLVYGDPVTVVVGAHQHVFYLIRITRHIFGTSLIHTQ